MYNNQREEEESTFKTLIYLNVRVRRDERMKVIKYEKINSYTIANKYNNILKLQIFFLNYLKWAEPIL